MREQSIDSARDREREQWESRLRMLALEAEVSMRHVERLDLAVDELRREKYHRDHPTTNPAND